MTIFSPGTRIGKYEIVSNPLEGGMGIVYFCIDHENDCPVALKTFKPEFLPDLAARDRFLREGTIWVKLGKHPHIVRCYAVEYNDPTAFLSLELIVKDPNLDDASLRAWIGRPMPVKQVLLFALQIARGLAYANKKIPGFVHRDLKPENVLVSMDKLPGTNVNRLLVTDFGLSSVLQISKGRFSNNNNSPDVTELTFKAGIRTQITHGAVGTPYYMAPEQWRNESVGVYTDIYALGCIMYEMLTGLTIVSGHTINDLQAAHCAGNFSLRTMNLSQEILDILMHSLALRPAERYQDWADVTNKLELAYFSVAKERAPVEILVPSESLSDSRQAGWSYNKLGAAYLHIDKAEVAASYFEKALALARKTGDRYGEGNALSNLGSACLHHGDPKRAIFYFEQTLAIARETGEKTEEGAALGNIGVAYANQGNSVDAVGYFEQNLVIACETGNQWEEGNALGNLGDAYLNMNDAQRAIWYCEQQLEISQKIGDRRGESRGSGLLGIAYMDLNNQQRAISYIKHGLLIDREIGNRWGECINLGNLGDAYGALGDDRKAIDFYESALVIDRDLCNRQSEAMHNWNLGLACEKLGNVDKAIIAFQICVDYKRSIGHPDAEIVAARIDNLRGQLQDSSMPYAKAQVAFAAFMGAANPEYMRDVVKQHPLMMTPQFIQDIQELIVKQTSADNKFLIEMRLNWLRKIVGK